MPPEPGVSPLPSMIPTDDIIKQDSDRPPPEPPKHFSSGETDSATRPTLGPGKKKDKKLADGRTAVQAGAEAMLPNTQAAAGAVRSDSPGQRLPQDIKAQSSPIPISPARHPYPSMAAAAAAASPLRLRSSSPRLHSPASSEIFERNVQEPVPIASIPDKEAAHIASHVMTEDHIPPALEASAQAITSEELNPDEVEIVTSVMHQPAAIGVLEGSSSHVDLAGLHAAHLQHSRSTGDESEAMSASHQSIAPLSAVPPELQDDGASNYGQLDPNDVRRLSFISFADVVQSEHQHAGAPILGEPGSRDSLHIASISSSLSGPEARAASPLRTPRSPGSIQGQAGATPPPAVNIDSARRFEQSPPRSVGAHNPAPGQHGDLNIETMRQAVRKTASGDLSGGRSAGMSPVSGDDFGFQETRSRTNS